MADTLRAAGAMCGMLIAAGLVSRLCPKDKMLGFVRGLVALALIASLCAAVISVDWEWPVAPDEMGENQELNEYMEDQYIAAAREEVESYIKGLLASAGIEAKKIRADIHITEDNSISCTKASLTFAFDSEARRARALLESVLEGVPLEVTADGA